MTVPQGDAGLLAAWHKVSAQVPKGYRLAGVTYHGPDSEKPWVAFLMLSETMESGGEEGWGNTPVEALGELSRRLQNTE
jgi:hypothetical protein